MNERMNERGKKSLSDHICLLSSNFELDDDAKEKTKKEVEGYYYYTTTTARSIRKRLEEINLFENHLLIHMLENGIGEEDADSEHIGGVLKEAGVSGNVLKVIE